MRTFLTLLSGTREFVAARLLQVHRGEEGLTTTEWALLTAAAAAAAIAVAAIVVTTATNIANSIPNG